MQWEKDKKKMNDFRPQVKKKIGVKLTPTLGFWKGKGLANFLLVFKVDDLMKLNFPS